MKLYVTHFSPFARMARVVLREKGLAARVEEIMAVTRNPDSPYYRVNPSGRVPFLEREDGPGIEGSQPVCWFLDHLDGAPAYDPPGGAAAFDHRWLEERARSFVDGVSVWVRELGRPPEDRSAAVIDHERQRMHRLADFWQAELDRPLMQGDMNMPQLTLACGLLLDQYFPGLDWRGGRPELAAWADRIAARPSFRATVPESQLSP
jgi:glutathione S-transferase